MRELTVPFDAETAASLRVGEMLLLRGELYTARDAAHKRLCALIAQREPLPLPLRGQTIYYTGPCPPAAGQIIGACGPTTSGRMDPYTPALLDAGVRVLIGKGERSEAVVQALRRNGAVYLAATGGVGALYRRSVRKCDCIAFAELGAEAIYRLEIEGFPAFVAIDSQGNSAYTQFVVKG